MTDTSEYEYSVIGAICIDSRIIDKIPFLKSDDFSISACGYIYEAAQDAVSRGKIFDAVIAADVIKTRVEAAESFIAHCMDLCPSCVNAEVHAKIIHKRAQLKALKADIDEILIGADDPETDPDQIAAEIVGVGQSYLQVGNAHKFKSMCEAVSTVYNRVTSPEKEERIETGFVKLDALLKGMPKGNLIFAGARPSVGKSAFAETIAENVARRNGTVLLYSLEMLADECAERSISKVSGIEMDNLIDNKIDQEQGKALMSACGTLGELPLYISDRSNVSPAVVRRDARMFKDIKLIIIDFISLMQSDKKLQQNRNLELGAISRDLKIIATELKVPILVLSQLSRNKSEHDEPTLSDLRDSGELEQNANKVIFLWVLEQYETGLKRIGVSVAKNRRGRLGAVEMEFDGSHMRLDEVVYLPTSRKKPERKNSKYGKGVFESDDE